MYDTLLVIHNILRWVVLILGLAAFGLALVGWLGKGDWKPINRRLTSFFSISLDIQILIGLLLYFVFSPITTAGLRDIGSAMSVADLRLFVIEHPLMMLLAVVFGHLGSALARRASTDTAKFRHAAIWTGLALLALLAGIPWERPLFRF